jgi:hypothetical protein
MRDRLCSWESLQRKAQILKLPLVLIDKTSFLTGIAIAGLIESMLPPGTEDGIISSWALTEISTQRPINFRPKVSRASRIMRAPFPRAPKPVLPNDLPKALGYLDDQDLDRLLRAAIDEVIRPNPIGCSQGPRSGQNMMAFQA